MSLTEAVATLRTPLTKLRIEDPLVAGSFLLRPGVSNECLPIVYLLVLGWSLVRQDATRQPTSRAGLPRTDRGSHAHPPPLTMKDDREPKITLAVVLDWKVCGGLREGVEGGEC